METRKRALLAVLLIFGVTGCGSGSGGSGNSNSAATGPNGIFSNWAQVPNPNVYSAAVEQGQLLFEGGAFNQESGVRVQTYDGAVCTANVLINGNNNSGTMTFSNIAYVSGGQGSSECVCMFDCGIQISGIPLPYVVQNNVLYIQYVISIPEGNNLAGGEVIGGSYQLN